MNLSLEGLEVRFFPDFCLGTGSKFRIFGGVSMGLKFGFDGRTSVEFE